MVITKKHTIVFLLSMSFLLLILRSCTTSEKASAEKIYEGLSRTEVLAKCISCHSEEHQNELLGPHSAAHRALLAHVDMVNKPEYPEKTYAAHVNEVKNTVCVKCHVPQNLFEYNFIKLDTLNDLSLCTKENFPNIFSPPPVRNDSRTFSSGVDCITCHFNGRNVVASADFIEDPQDREMKDYCFPVRSKFLSSNMFCATCHNHDVESHEEYFKSGLVAQQTCVSCHIEKKEGESTHYFYWRHDPAEKRNFSFYNKLFDNVTAEIGDDAVHIKWVNSEIPHIFNRVREIVTKWEVLGQDDKVIQTSIIRLNRKHDHDVFMKKVFGDYQLPGINGYVFTTGDTIKEKIFLPAEANAIKLKVSAFNKAQYFFPDSAGVLFFEKEFLLEQKNPL